MCCSCQSPSVCSFSCSGINDKNCMYVYLLFLSMFSSNSCLGPTTNLVVLLPQSDKINLDCYSIVVHSCPLHSSNFTHHCISSTDFITVWVHWLFTNMSLPCHQSIHRLIIIMSNCLDHHSYCCCRWQAVNVINFFTGCLSSWRYVCYSYSFIVTHSGIYIYQNIHNNDLRQITKFNYILMNLHNLLSAHTGGMLEKVFKSALRYHTHLPCIWKHNQNLHQKNVSITSL